MIRTPLALLGAAGIVIATALLAVILFQWSWLRQPLESSLSALTGKQVHIDGPIDGTKSLVPYIELNQVRIEEPGFTGAPKVATIEKISVAIDLESLVRGKLSFPVIDIDRPVLDLMRRPDGTANWDIAQETKGPSERTNMPLIGRLSVEDGKFTYRDVAHKVTITAAITSVAATGGNGDEAFKIDGKGVYRQVPFTLKLSGGSLNQLRETKEPYTIDATASVGKTRVSVVGTVTDPFKLTDLNLKLTADGDNASDLYPIFGIPAPPTPPYHLKGRLDRDGKIWLFKDFAGTVGKSDLEGSLRYRPEEGHRIFVGGNLQSKTLDFADLGLLVGAPGSTAANRPVSDEQKQIEQKLVSEGRVLPDMPLNIEEVRDVDTDLTFKALHVDAPHLPLDNVELHLDLDHGLMKLTPLRVGVADGQVDADIVIDARTDTVSTDYDVRLSQFRIDQIFQKAGYPGGGSGALDGRIRLHGTGNSVRASLGTANGQASALVDKGQVSNLIANALGLDVARALGVLIAGDKQVPLNCVVADFEVKDGVMTPRTFVIDTDAALTRGKGTIDLKNEKLDLSFDGDPKKMTPLALGGPILVSGTFRNPSVGLGTLAYLRGGASVALGAILTPLAAIIGFLDLGDVKPADCAGLTQTAAANATARPKGAKHMPAHPHPGPVLAQH